MIWTYPKQASSNALEETFSMQIYHPPRQNNKAEEDMDECNKDSLEEVQSI